MEVNVEKLKGKIVECGITQGELAEAIGIHRTTFHRKMQERGVNLTLREVWGIIVKLHLNYVEISEIFLNI